MNITVNELKVIEKSYMQEVKKLTEANVKLIEWKEEMIAMLQSKEREIFRLKKLLKLKGEIYGVKKFGRKR